MKLNSKDFALDDIWKILSLVEESEEHLVTVVDKTYYQFEVIGDAEVQWGDETVLVESGLHVLILDRFTAEWVRYVKQT
jgi:hypothetical protein